MKEGAHEFTVLEVMPKTGRTHQIRVHLSSIGHPVAGDKLYGKHGQLPGLDRQFLHAQKIEFKLPDGKVLRAEATLPKELAEVVARLEGATEQLE